MPDTPEGTTSDVFGPAADDDLFADFVDEPEEPPAAEAEGQPLSEPPQEAPATEDLQQPEDQPTSDDQPEPEAEQTPTAEQPAEFSIGRFKGSDPETVARQVHAAWENSQRLMTQRAQEAAQARREREELIEMLKRSEPLLRQAAELQGQAQQVEFDPEDPQAMQAYLDQRAAQIAEQKVAEQLRPIQEAQERQRNEAGLREVEAFRQAHPDSRSYDAEIFEVLQQHGQEDFPPTAENLSVAYALVTNPEVRSLVDQTDYIPDPQIVTHATEAVGNPALLEVVEANPQFLVTDKGMNFARKLAGLPQAVTQAQQTHTQATQAAAQAARAAAHVEIDEGPEGTAPGKKPQDPLEEALFEDLAKEQAGSIFR